MHDHQTAIRVNTRRRAGDDESLAPAAADGGFVGAHGEIQPADRVPEQR